MKTELRLAPHTAGTGRIVEVWHDGAFIASVYPLGDGPGVRVVTKHRIIVDHLETRAIAGVGALTVHIEP